MKTPVVKSNNPSELQLVIKQLTREINALEDKVKIGGGSSTTVTSTSSRGGSSATIQTGPQGPIGPTGPQGPQGIQGEPGISNLTDSFIIGAAAEGPIASITFSSGLPTAITYDDYDGFTSKSKAITYTDGLPTQIVFTFTYNLETWTVTTNLTYSGGLPATKTVAVGKV